MSYKDVLAKESTFSTGEDCHQPNTPAIQLVLLKNPRLQVQQFISTNTKWGSADVIRSPSKSAEDCFITMIRKKRGDVGADKLVPITRLRDNSGPRVQNT
jgi:hypothetical protein